MVFTSEAHDLRTPWERNEHLGFAASEHQRTGQVKNSFGAVVLHFALPLLA
jgi:hypothetical protein